MQVSTFLLGHLSSEIVVVWTWQTKPYTAKAKPYIQPVVPYIEKAKPYAPPLAAALVVLASIPVFFTLFLLAAITSPVRISDQQYARLHIMPALSAESMAYTAGVRAGLGVLRAHHLVYLGAPRHRCLHRFRYRLLLRRSDRNHPVLLQAQGPGHPSQAVEDHLFDHLWQEDLLSVDTVMYLPRDARRCKSTGHRGVQAQDWIVHSIRGTAVLGSVGRRLYRSDSPKSPPGLKTCSGASADLIPGSRSAWSHARDRADPLLDAETALPLAPVAGAEAAQPPPQPPHVLCAAGPNSVLFSLREGAVGSEPLLLP